MTSVNTIRVYEVSGVETKVGDGVNINVKNHSIHWDSLIIIGVGDKSFTVEADELIRAIKNATNSKQ